MPEESEHNIMTAVSLLDAFAESGVQDDFEIWLSSDEEGNQFLPMPANPELSLAIDASRKSPELSLAIDASRKRVVLFPSHR